MLTDELLAALPEWARQEISRLLLVDKAFRDQGITVAAKEDGVEVSADGQIFIAPSSSGSLLFKTKAS